MKQYLIIVAGGSGSRMNSEVPKQFMKLAGKPVLMHTVERFLKVNPEINIVIVLPQTLFGQWNDLCKEHSFQHPHKVTEGGETRYYSVKKGLELVPDACVVGIHDAARPLVSSATILKAYADAETLGNAVPVVALTDSLRFIKGKENCAVDRNLYRIVQTPQCFHSDLIRKAFLKAYKPEFTDDASVLESFGEKINLTEGNSENIKITTPNDMVIAEALLSKVL